MADDVKRRRAVADLEKAQELKYLYLTDDGNRIIPIHKGDGLWFRAIARYKIDCLKDINKEDT